MAAFLTILACFAGVFAFAFGVAGFVGLMSFDPPKDKRSALLSFVDHLVTGGVVSMLSDVGRNWSERAEERRQVYIGVVCGLVCVLLVTVVKGMS